MSGLDNQLADVISAIQKVEAEIEKLEKKLENEEDQNKEKQLREEKKQLREEKKQLREEKIFLLKKEGTMEEQLREEKIFLLKQQTLEQEISQKNAGSSGGAKSMGLVCVGALGLYAEKAPLPKGLTWLREANGYWPIIITMFAAAFELWITYGPRLKASAASATTTTGWFCLMFLFVLMFLVAFPFLALYTCFGRLRSCCIRCRGRGN